MATKSSASPIRREQRPGLFIIARGSSVETLTSKPRLKASTHRQKFQTEPRTVIKAMLPPYLGGYSVASLSAGSSGPIQGSHQPAQLLRLHIGSSFLLVVFEKNKRSVRATALDFSATLNENLTPSSQNVNPSQPKVFHSPFLPQKQVSETQLIYLLRMLKLD